MTRDSGMHWWNPNSVLHEVNRRKRAGLCPTCEHGPHRDGPCDLCGDRCHYPKTLDADLARFAEARADVGKALAAEVERLFAAIERRIRRGR